MILRNAHISYVLLGISMVSSIFKTHAQSCTIKDSSAHCCKLNKWYFIPIVVYSPEYSLALGGGAIYLFKFPGADSLTRTSNFQGSLRYTLNNQILSENNFFLITNHDRYIIRGTLGYNKFPVYYYGMGNHTGEQRERISYEMIKSETVVLKKIACHLYAGLGYRYFNMYNVKIEHNGQLASTNTAGSNGSVTSGLSLALTYDSRNNVMNTTRGSYASIIHTIHGHAFGGSHNFQRLVMDMRKFIHPFCRKGATLALQGYFQATGGNTPFNELGLLGGSMIMRGYYMGRYRDRILGAVQAEYRVALTGRFGMAAFAGTGQVADQVNHLNPASFKVGYGMGLRIKIDKKECLNLRADYGIGNGKGFCYITIGEAF